MKTIILQRPEWQFAVDTVPLVERIGHQTAAHSTSAVTVVSVIPRWPEVLVDLVDHRTGSMVVLMGNVYYSAVAIDRIHEAGDKGKLWFMGRPEPRHGHCSELFAMGGPSYMLLLAIQSAAKDGAFRLWDIYAAYNDLPTRFSTCPEVHDNLIIQDDETEDFFSDDDVKAWQGYRYEAQQMAEAHRLWTTHGMYTRHVINKMKQEAK